MGSVVVFYLSTPRRKKLVAQGRKHGWNIPGVILKPHGWEFSKQNLPGNLGSVSFCHQKLYRSTPKPPTWERMFW